MATNDELLEQIGKLIDAKLEPLKRDMATKADLRDMATSAKLDGVKQEIIGKIEKEAESTAAFFHETWAKMEATNERITKLEEYTGINKN